ncbi:MAG: UDP-4-amino-4-deoxy-L-arabinose--oxoglutarate aminotransferase [Burkholderiaceae bacterium]|nr:UDP-4-amino-4-deoxy-L-arabinose--oxoglutarate aminotransferase [Burkholderiaceae bacterium]
MPLPRLPVMGWSALEGARAASVPSLLDRQQVVLTSSGSAAILLALEALDTSLGQRVLVPTYHCPTMVAPVQTLGAQPLFYPLTESGAPDLDWLSRQSLHDVKAMVAVHFFGLPQPMEPVAAWCRERSIALIEDCAHALFGLAAGQPVGRWGAFAIGSLKKFLPVDDGGCLVPNHPFVLPALSKRSFTADLKSALNTIELGARYGRLRGAGFAVMAGLGLVRRVRGRRPFVAEPGDEDRIDAVASKLDVALAHRRITRPSSWLARWLPRERIVERRRRHYAHLVERLGASRAMHPLLPALPSHCAPYVFPLWVRQPDPGYLALRGAGVPVYRWNRCWPGTPLIPGDSGPAWAHHVLQIGCHQDLSDHDVDCITDILLQTFEVDAPGSIDET